MTPPDIATNFSVFKDEAIPYVNQAEASGNCSQCAKTAADYRSDINHWRISSNIAQGQGRSRLDLFIKYNFRCVQVSQNKHITEYVGEIQRISFSALSIVVFVYVCMFVRVCPCVCACVYVCVRARVCAS